MSSLGFQTGKSLDMPGIESGTFCKQSSCSATDLTALPLISLVISSLEVAALCPCKFRLVASSLTKNGPQSCSLSLKSTMGSI